MLKRHAYLAGILIAIILMVIPFTVNAYLLSVLITIAMYMVLALGLNILPGYCGLLDLGYVGFFCTGAYTTAFLVTTCGWSFWLTIPLALLSGAIWGILLGAPTLRLTGDYFAIVTFGFSEMVVLLSRNWTSVTGGARGFPGIPSPTLNLDWMPEILKESLVSLLALKEGAAGSYTFALVPPRAYYYLIILFLGLTVFVVHRLANSRLGRAWFAIREDEVAAESTGINIMWYKTIAFAISASLAGLAGAFYAVYARNLHWSRFQFWDSILILCLIVLGGLGSIRGAMIGTTILISLTEILRFLLDKFDLPADTRFLFYGLIMILIMRYRPEGLFGITRVKQEMRPEEERIRKVEDSSFYEESK
ncbi:MAG: branched-chain amino acid ABC transporter permease [bacterium]|nr:branched-chain amino acid ABC transporter permease [bacterium]